MENLRGGTLIIVSDAQLSEITTALIQSVSPKVLSKAMAGAAVRTMRTLSTGRPVSLRQVAQACEISVEEADQVVQQFRNMGLAELDSNGAIVGMIVSLQPTVHRLRVNNVNLFAWCAIDTLFLPSVLDRPAEVESVCGGTGESVRLSVAPDGVKSVIPVHAVLSIVAPGCTPGIDAQCGPALVGSQGAFCGNVLFFSSTEAALPWLSSHPGAVILPIKEAHELARKVWAIPFLESLSEVSS